MNEKEFEQRVESEYETTISEIKHSYGDSETGKSMIAGAFILKYNLIHEDELRERREKKE